MLSIRKIKASKKLDAWTKRMWIDGRRRELKMLKQRKAKGFCNAKLHHGPGHQSSTFCEARGKHTVHYCTYGEFDDYMEWSGRMKAFAPYYDLY